MAESVDALVSNTSGFTSIPVRPRVWVQEKEKVRKAFSFFCLFLLLYFLLLSCFYLHTYTLYTFVDNQNVSRVENMYKECREAVFSTQTAII